MAYHMMSFRSHISLLIVLFGFLGLISFPVEAAIKKYQFDVSYMQIVYYISMVKIIISMLLFIYLFIKHSFTKT